MPHFMPSSRSKAAVLRTLDVRPDDTDARDYIFQPSLALLPDRLDHRRYAPILDQGAEGACVGFSLATVINVSLNRRSRDISPRHRGKRPGPVRVSPRMLYEMGRRYDEWAGERYEGTSLRGAMKGWHKHGVTTDQLWPYRVRRKGKRVADREFTLERAQDAMRRPLGAYYRITDSDVSHLQAALMEADAVLVSAWIHSGWQL
ncbi:MAG: C1 family peptidase, partial [Candidatus Methylomirabilis sp.]